MGQRCVSPLVEVVVILRPLNVDEFLVLLLVSFPTRDGEVLHVLQGLPQGFHRFRRYLDHHTVYGWRRKKEKGEKKSLVMVLIFLILLQLKAKAEEPSLESA